MRCSLQQICANILFWPSQQSATALNNIHIFKIAMKRKLTADNYLEHYKLMPVCDFWP